MGPSELRDDPLGDQSEASQSQEDVCVYLANERSQPSAFVYVFDHDHAWRRNIENVIPPIGAFVVITVANHRWILAAHTSRCRIAYERQAILKNAVDARIGKSRVW